MDLAHPFGIASGEVVVDRDLVNTPPTEAVEIHRQYRGECLAFAGFHLGYPTEVQTGAAHQLNVVGPLADNAECGLATYREALEQDVVEICAVGEDAVGIRLSWPAADRR